MKPLMRFSCGMWTCRSARDGNVFIVGSKNPFNAYIGWAEINYRQVAK